MKPEVFYQSPADPLTDLPAAEPGSAETSTALDDAPGGESLFETFVDEIDVWARRALAANGFGDY
jgi:hypothetical protein